MEMSIDGDGPDGQISLHPSPELFEDEISRILRDGIDLVNIPEPLLGHRDLQTYVTAAASGGSDSHENGGGAGKRIVFFLIVFLSCFFLKIICLTNVTPLLLATHISTKSFQVRTRMITEMMQRKP